MWAYSIWHGIYPLMQLVGEVWVQGRYDYRMYLEVTLEQRIVPLAPLSELGGMSLLHLGMLFLQLHVDHQHFPLCVLPVFRIRHCYTMLVLVRLVVYFQPFCYPYICYVCFLLLAIIIDYTQKWHKRKYIRIIIIPKKGRVLLCPTGPTHTITSPS